MPNLLSMKVSFSGFIPDSSDKNLKTNEKKLSSQYCDISLRSCVPGLKLSAECGRLWQSLLCYQLWVWVGGPG